MRSTVGRNFLYNVTTRLASRGPVCLTSALFSSAILSFCCLLCYSNIRDGALNTLLVRQTLSLGVIITTVRSIRVSRLVGLPLLLRLGLGSGLKPGPARPEKTRPSRPKKRPGPAGADHVSLMKRPKTRPGSARVDPIDGGAFEV